VFRTTIRTIKKRLPPADLRCRRFHMRVDPVLPCCRQPRASQHESQCSLRAPPPSTPFGSFVNRLSRTLRIFIRNRLVSFFSLHRCACSPTSSFKQQRALFSMP
jgi:hypothetical protein